MAFLAASAAAHRLGGTPPWTRCRGPWGAASRGDPPQHAAQGSGCSVTHGAGTAPGRSRRAARTRGRHRVLGPLPTAGVSHGEGSATARGRRREPQVLATKVPTFQQSSTWWKWAHCKKSSNNRRCQHAVTTALIFIVACTRSYPAY